MAQPGAAEHADAVGSGPGREASGGVERLFVAVDPTPPAAAHLAAAVADLDVGRAAARGVNARPVPPERWHLTLAFLGDVPPADRPAVEEALWVGAAAWRSRARDPLVLHLAGGGTFGRGPSTILWAGVGGAAGELAHLARQLRVALRRRRLPFDGKPFRPHLTLARPGTRLDPAPDVAALAAYAGPPWTPAAVHLYRSTPGPDPHYTRLSTTDLHPPP
ncbi:RNA 2',3'-cyclic phosphodiesterase [Pilimelia anulata]|uniref:RNA 2',3'-cyclic phosphodiesterase n=1 Tax=Pilimelia anulata TaxID=53371 RepID=A0A8J3FA37_9ACTN|nr:RNA 2',3'-cyclic phosphodiesterase [Pilimelia anulata]GGJ96219.1 RNA 2',3'-cyclic phosphodiesterase [Pilimelia anulata]